MRYSCGYSCSVTGLERVDLTAMLPENQNIAKLNTRARTRAIVAPLVPPSTPPIRTNRPPIAALRTQVFTRLMPIMGDPSFIGAFAVRRRPVLAPDPRPQRR